MNKALSLLKRTFQKWQSDNVSVLASSLAYYTVFSLAPLLIILIAVLNLASGFLGQAFGQQELVAQLRGVFGDGVADFIKTIIEQRQGNTSGDVLATVVGVVLLIVGATGVFVQLQNALNRIWDVPPGGKGGVVHLLRARLVSFALVVGIGFLLIVSLVATALVDALSNSARALLPGTDFFWGLAVEGVSFVVLTLFFGVLFKVLPDAQVKWRDIWAGAAVTALLFVVGKTLIGLYLSKSAVASTYGSAGSLVVLLLWLFYSAQIFLFGAEFTRVYSARHEEKLPVTS
ncbi:N/A [soil metagenome]